MMKKPTVSLMLWLLLSLHLNVQTAPAASQAADLKTQEKSPELIEATNLSVQVVKYYKEGNYDAALPLARRAVELREKALGREHTLVGDALVNLASIYIGKQKFGDAESSFERGLDIYAKAYGAENPKLSGILENLGWLKFANRDYGKAEDFMQRALAIKEKAFGENSKEVSQSLVSLGLMKQRLRRYAEAVPFYQRAFDAREKVSGADSKELADLAQKCSCALKLNKQHQESEEYAQRAREIRSPEGAGANVVRRNGGVLAGSATHREQPGYPIEAKRAAVSGAVIVEVTVDETGKVIQSRVLCGDELLSYSAEQAARKWRFTPTLLSGVPVKVVGTITFNFNL
jgi:TonB family protein